MTTYAFSNETETLAVIDAQSKRDACDVFVKTHGGETHHSSRVIYVIHPRYGAVKAERVEGEK